MTTRARALGLAQLATGGVLLAWNRHPIGYDEADPWPHRLVLAARVLGARYVLQGALIASYPSSEILRLAAGTDAVHAASMGAVMYVRRLRRPAALSAAVAVAFAAATALTADRDAAK